MIKQTIIHIPYGKIGYLLQFSMAYHHAKDGPSEKIQLTITILLKAYCREVELRYQWNGTLSKPLYAYFVTIQRSTDKNLLKDIEGTRKPLRIVNVGQSVTVVEKNSKRS